eukprot:SM000134S26944  [mRNA]  locus=s134:194785:198483:+ [translate_table: standard]
MQLLTEPSLAQSPTGPPKAAMAGAHIGHALAGLAQGSQRAEVVTVCGSRRRTGHDVVEQVTALAAGLAELGLAPGERVAIVALNSDWYLDWLLAVPCAGAVLAPLNYRWSLEEAAAAVRQVGAAVLAVDGHHLHWWPKLLTACPSLRLAVLLDDGAVSPNLSSCVAMEDVRKAGAGSKLVLRIAPNGTALICFTSGTTGAPKGAALSHTALVVQSMAKLVAIGYTSKDMYLHITPLCHIGGISSALAMVMARGRHIFLPRFDPAQATQAVFEHHVTALIAVPTMLTDLASAGHRSLESVVKVLVGAGGLTKKQKKEAFALFPAAQILCAYGMTEACSSITFQEVRAAPQGGSSWPQRWEQATRAECSPCVGGHCVGIPAPHVEICIHDDDQEAAHSPGKVGEVLVRGPLLMTEYWGRPDDSRAAFLDGGWLQTGDIGALDGSGQLWLLGRRKDVIKTGGENVYASEVEAALLRHPGIVAAAVVGLPDPRLGEVAAAVIVHAPGWEWRGPCKERNGSAAQVGGLHKTHRSWTKSAKDAGQEAGGLQPLPGNGERQLLSLAALQEHCRALGMSRYKVPRVVVSRARGLPVTSTGKVQKDEVRQLIQRALVGPEALTTSRL